MALRVVRTVALGVCALLAAVSSARAQALGQVAGIVTNPHGAGLAGASLSLDNAGLPQPLVVVTTASGAFEFPRVPVGTYTLTCRVDGFRDVVVRRVDVTNRRTATVDLTLETTSGVRELPFDAGRTTTGQTIDTNVMLHVPTARDPWQIIKLVPGVTMNGINVAGSTSGQQMTPSAFGSSADVQWHVDGGSTTDMVANASPGYYNFDSLDAVQVITGGADVSVGSAGVFINLITKSGTNTLSGSATSTLASSALQSQNVSQDVFLAGTAAGSPVTGSPLRHIAVTSAEIGGPISRDRVWFWGGADNQDIDVAAASFDTTRAGCDQPPWTFSSLDAVQTCLADDKTTIRNVNGKLTSRIGAAHTVRLLYQTNQKLRNNRPPSSGASPTDVSSSVSQYRGGSTWTASPTVQATHTWHPLGGLVVDNQFTYAANTFFLDSHDYTRCGSSTYARDVAGQDPTDPSCAWNVQALANRTTGSTTGAPATGSYQTSRPSWELKTDEHALLSHALGGDHTFRFGAGWRRDPVLSYTHHDGGATATVQCLQNLLTDCPGSPTPTPIGIVPYEAAVWRDGLTQYAWTGFGWYAQDTYTTRRLTLAGGTRWDYQDSRFLGGCVSANVIVPTLLPRKCQDSIDTNQPFHAFSPRVAATYDLTGDGRMTVHGSMAYYHQTSFVLAKAFDNLGAGSLTFGPNTSSGACRAFSCWTDANHDGIVQASELSGTPTPSSSRLVDGCLSFTCFSPIVDPNLQPGRTREGIVGVDGELGRTLHVAVNFVYRIYDLGSASYAMPPGDESPAQFISEAASDWQRQTWTDPSTGISTPYYTLCSGCSLFSSGTLLTTNLTRTTDKSVNLALTKRLSSHWQGGVSYTWNDTRVFTSAGLLAISGTPANPTGVDFTNGFTNGTPPHDLKAFGYVEWPRGWTTGFNLGVRSGDVRILTIDGPGAVPSGTGTVTYASLQFQPAGTTRMPIQSQLDLNVAKSLRFGRKTLTFAVDCFNALNAGTALSYLSNDISAAVENNSQMPFNFVRTMMPPRVFRIDARFAF
jgi:hypothetical protein